MSKYFSFDYRYCCRNTLKISLLLVILFAFIVSLFSFTLNADAATSQAIKIQNASAMPAVSNGKYVYISHIARDNFKVTINNSGLYYDKTFVDGDIHEKIATYETIPSGAQRTYTGANGKPAVVLTWTKGGYSSDGQYVDIVLELNKIELEGKGNPARIFDFWPEDTFPDDNAGPELAAWYTKANMSCTIKIVKTGTNSLLTGYAYRLDLTDLDITSSDTFYTEGFIPKSGFLNNSIYIAQDTFLSTKTVTIDGSQYTKFEATTSDHSSFRSTASSYVANGSATFNWTGNDCGTNILIQAFVPPSPSADASLTKSVSKSEVNRNETFSYTISQTIPYTYSNNKSGQSNAYSKIVFTDTLNNALDASSTTLTIYRTDNLTNATEKNDTSNWTVTKSGQTITATHKNTENAGGKYRFVINTKIKSNANLSSYADTTMQNGGPGKSFTNVAKISIGAYTHNSNTVTTKVPTAKVRYILLGTDFPTDGKTPPAEYNGYANERYTVSDILKTNDEGAWFFDGWYEDAAMTQKATGSILLSNGTTTLYGVWLPGAISLAKYSEQDSYDDIYAGDEISWSLQAMNSGKSKLHDISIVDELLGGNIYNYSSNINANDMLDTGNIEYTVTQEDLDRGYIENHATVSAKDPIDNIVNAQADKTVKLVQNPSISLEKTADTDCLEDAHADKTIVTYSFTITNTGNVTLHNISLNDPMLDGQIALDKTELAPNEQATATATYTVKQSDIENGIITNTATVNGTSPANSIVNDDDTYTIDVLQNPSVSFTKNVNKEELLNAHADDVIVYTFLITNTGNTILSDLTMNDELLGGNTTSVLNKTTLYPGESSVGTMNYVIKQSDIDSGRVVNNADIAIVSKSNNQTLTADDDAITDIIRTASISFEKFADRDHLSNASSDDMVTYMFRVTNTGNTTITNGKISDPLLGALSLNKTTLLPGESATANKQYTITQNDIDSGARDNTATTTWNQYDGNELTEESSWHIDIDRTPSIALSKEIIGDTIIKNASEGDQISFSLTISNTGNTTLTNIELTDRLQDAIIDDSEMKTTLLPGESTHATATYSLKQRDIDSGDVTNIADVIGKTPDGCTPDTVSSNDSADVDIVREPSIFLDKTAQPSQLDGALPGDEITYTLTIENNGNTTLDNIILTDPMLGGNIELDKTTLLPGESTQVNRQYALTQADIDNGHVHNEAAAVSTAPEGSNNPNPSATDYADVDLTQSPELVINKNIVLHDGKNQNDLTTGDEIFFSIVIGNAGNTTLTDVQLVDDMLGGNISLEKAVKGIDMSLIGLNKQDETSNDDIQADVGESTEDENNSNGSVDDITAIDTLHIYGDSHSIDGTLPITTLQPGEYLYIELPYTITQEDMNNSIIDNIAQATALPPMKQDGAQERLEVSDEATMDLPAHPGVELIKEADVDEINDAVEGNMIHYTLTIKNTGDVSLNDISLSDELEGIVIDDSELDELVLEPGDIKTINASYYVVLSDIENGQIDNHATVVASSVSKCVADGYDGSVTDEDTASVKLYAPLQMPEQENDVLDILLAQTGDSPVKTILPLTAVLMILTTLSALIIRKRDKK